MEKYYIAAINAANLMGSQRCRRLINFFGSAKAAWAAEPGEIEKSGVPPVALESFFAFRQKNPDAPEKLMEFCDAKEVSLCSIVDEDYPPILKEIQNPPVVFYYRGILKTLAERIAIVGSRNNTSYGQRAAFSLGKDLAAAGLTVVSGAARGIDTNAHRGALQTGRTVAVLGCGIKFVFPRENKKLLEEISESGLVMTEFEPGLAPNATTFPARNRIIAGLSRGVIVVEAGKKSGALITSTYAGDYGRDVFAVPGNIYSDMSVGCNELIRDGATLITCAEDVLAEYNFKPEEKKISEPVKLSGDEEKIFKLIPAGEFVTLDEILIEADDIEPNEISSLVLQLEIKNCIVEEDGKYSRIR